MVTFWETLTNPASRLSVGKPTLYSPNPTSEHTHFHTSASIKPSDVVTHEKWTHTHLHAHKGTSEVLFGQPHPSVTSWDAFLSSSLELQNDAVEMMETFVPASLDSVRRVNRLFSTKSAQIQWYRFPGILKPPGSRGCSF